MNTSQIVVAVLQTVGGALLLMISGVVGWMLRELFKQRSDHERLRAQVEAHTDSYRNEITSLRQWMQAVSTKLDATQTAMTTMLVKVTEVATEARIRDKVDEARDDRDEARRPASSGATHPDRSSDPFPGFLKIFFTP